MCSEYLQVYFIPSIQFDTLTFPACVYLLGLPGCFLWGMGAHVTIAGRRRRHVVVHTVRLSVERTPLLGPVKNEISHSDE